MMQETMLYEDYIRTQVKEKSVYGTTTLPTHILCDIADWIEKVRSENVQMRKIIERQNLPYDALGDYSHDSTEFHTADEWYRENFGAERVK